MKVSRSYLLGLGSGLILSAMLTLVISPFQGYFLVSKKAVSTQPVTPQVSQPLTVTGKTSNSTEVDKPVSSQPTQVTPSLPQVASQTQRDFVIPEGAKAFEIADLLVKEGYIQDETTFLEITHQLGAESKFRAGTYTLTLGLTPDELIQRFLIK